MKKLVFVLSLVIMFASISTIAFAQPGPRSNKKMFKERMIDKLNLTDDQQEKIEKLRDVHQKRMIDYKAELEKAQIDMRTLKNDKNLSRNSLIAGVERINTIKNKMALEKASHQMDIYELLTNEQKEIWREQKPMRDHFGMRNHDRKFDRKGFNRQGPPEFQEN